MPFPAQWQQQNGWAGQYGLPSPSNMHLGTGMSYANPATCDGDYPNQQNSLDMGPHTIHGQTAPATIAAFSPWHNVQQNITASSPARQDPPSSVQTAHPSDVVTCLDEAMAAMPQRSWHCPINDATLPAIDQEREQWVQKLLNAVNNLADIQGNQGKKNNATLEKRWLAPLTGPAYYLPADKLTLCWTIEDLVERLHRFGPSVLHSFDDSFWESAVKTSSWTFQCRMTRIIELLAVSKTKCDSLLGDGGMQSIVANPGEKIVATVLQAKQNAKRSGLLQVGREARKQMSGRVAKRQKTSARK